MDQDKNGNPVVYVIYDRSKSGTTAGWWRVAFFKSAVNAQKFLEEVNNENYVISCQTASKRDFGLVRD